MDEKMVESNLKLRYALMIINLTSPIFDNQMVY